VVAVTDPIAPPFSHFVPHLVSKASSPLLVDRLSYTFPPSCPWHLVPKKKSVPFNCSFSLQFRGNRASSSPSTSEDSFHGKPTSFPSQ